MGFRPLTVYGPGRDFGLTADPTLAMKAAVLGRPFQIRWGGATDLIYADDVARACIAASTATLEGARVYNLHGESAKVADIARLIEEAWPSAKGTITHVEQPIPFPSELADPGYQRDLGPVPRTALKDGIRKTLDEFAALQKAGRSTRASWSRRRDGTDHAPARATGDAEAVCTIYNQGIEDRVATLEIEPRTLKSAASGWRRAAPAIR